MPIPNFTGEGILPAHLGDPAQPSDLSPYPVTTVELIQRFGGSPERKQILAGFLELRARLHQAGFMRGFQWLDGSFLEDVEQIESRPPNDIDVVTFYCPTDASFAATVLAAFPEIRDHGHVKNVFRSDHYLVNILHNPFLTVESSRYWYALFSHRRDGQWKGMLRLELGTLQQDTDAGDLLRGPQP